MSHTITAHAATTLRLSTNTQYCFSRSVLAARLLLVHITMLVYAFHVAVYLITFHSYCSWMPDHPRGYVKRKKGILACDPKLAQHYRRRAKHEKVQFTADDCEYLLEVAAQECSLPSRGWSLHMGVAVFNHVHLLIGWEVFVPIDRVKAVLHRALNVALRDRLGASSGRPFLSRGGTARRVADGEHFDHLICTYLPSHRKYGGVIWRVTDDGRSEDAAAVNERAVGLRFSF